MQHDWCVCVTREDVAPGYIELFKKTDFMHKELIFIFNKHSNINDNINPRGKKVF